MNPTAGSTGRCSTSSPTKPPRLVYALRRDNELQSTRRQALETVAEERARLGRDLHDGIAPLLAGAGLTAEALRKGMAPGTADEQDAERLASRLRNAATEIRRLAHDLQPAPVEDRGLEAALADYIATLDAPEMPRIQFRADDRWIVADGSGAGGLPGRTRGFEQRGPTCPRLALRGGCDPRIR